MARSKLIFVFLCAALVAMAQRAMTLAEVTGFVKSQIKLKSDDRATADFLRKVKLTQKLEDTVVEELQGLGAGSKTVAALRALEQESAGLPAAPAAAPVAAKPAPKAPPDSMVQAEVLAAMRDYALNYTEKLPNYLCIQMTRRHYDPKDPRYRTSGDVIQEQLSFNDHVEKYTVQMVNGKAAHNVSHEQLGGVRSSGEFGSMLHDIFAPQSETQFGWDHWGTWDARPVYVFSYQIEKEHGYSMRDDETSKHYTSAYTGLVYADQETKEIARITMKTVEIPAEFPIKEVNLALNYKPTTISGRVYTLPAFMELDSTDIHGAAKNTEEFKMYQVYTADAVIKFEDTGPPAEDQKEQPAKPPVKKQP
jgi:hypothetical protein